MHNKNSHTLFDLMHLNGGNELWKDIVGYEDGGFVGYQYGGGTSAEQILQDQGLTATPEQLALFADMDTTQIQDLATGLQEGLLAGGQQQAQQIAGAGFAGGGAGGQALSQQRKRSEQALSTGIERAKTAFESQTLGTAADIVAGGGEFGTYGGSGTMTDAQTEGGGTTTIPNAPANPRPNQRHSYGGVVYQWDAEAGQWFELTRD